METTIEELNTDLNYTRRTMKDAFASLTIGSGSAAILLTNEKISRTGNRFLGAVAQCDTQGSALCRSQVDVTAGGRASGQTMKTDSEKLLHTGVELANRAFEVYRRELGLDATSLDRLFCHQVGKAHQKLLFETLGLDLNKNFATLPYLGNTPRRGESNRASRVPARRSDSSESGRASTWCWGGSNGIRRFPPPRRRRAKRFRASLR